MSIKDVPDLMTNHGMEFVLRTCHDTTQNAAKSSIDNFAEQETVGKRKESVGPMV
jgi:hypothetical protein